MYCSECRCEFEGWTGKCPNCKTPLVEGPSPIPEIADEPLSYEALVGLVRENGGQLSIDLSTSEVSKKRSWSFPYFGYGSARAERMQGTFNQVLVDLVTTEAGEAKRRGFPWRGYRFAWAEAMQGSIAGNQVALTAEKVSRKKEWSFPYSGYGYGWTQAMTGECGGELKVDLQTTDVGTDKRWRFPYGGFGFAWANRCILTLRLSE